MARLIESVLIPASPALYGEPSDRHTLCVSTQVGCAYGCKFCASGLDGWKRDLGVEEIVNQVLAVERLEGGGGRMINNLVIMGMGEPLANYENLLQALRILNAPWGGHLGARKITVSTSGLAPQIRRLADEPQQFRLAVSLHGATDQTRGRLMPINKKYPLKELAAACDYYQRKKGRMITLEYILIAGVNDALDQAAAAGQAGPSSARQGQLDSLQQGGGPALGASRRAGAGGLSGGLGAAQSRRHLAPGKRRRDRRRLRPTPPQDGAGTENRRLNLARASSLDARR